MSQVNDTGHKSYAATGALGKHILVKLASATTISAAGLNEEAIGTIDDEAFAAGDVRSVSLKSKQGTIKAVASGAFSAMAAVYGRANGKVDDIASGAIRLGIALEAATAADDIVEVLPDGP